VSLRRSAIGLTALAACLACAATRLPAQETATVLDGVRYGALSGAHLTVRFAPRDSLVAGRVLALLQGQRPLPGLPDTVPRGVTAILAHSAAAFDEATGGVVPEWRAGVAIPALDVLVVPTGEGRRILDAEGLRTLRHEWAHLGLSQYLGDLRAPRWFDEGYAQWASGGWDVAGAWRLRVLLALGQAPRMDSLLLAWPRERTDAETAYLLAASAVTYLLQESGERGLEVFLARWRAERSFEGALLRTFGVSVGQLEEDWRRHVRRRYGWLFVASRSAVFWLLMALVLLVMARFRHAYDRERMARLRAGDGPEEPAFWSRDGSEG
jgi:hypothetical protein